MVTKKQIFEKITTLLHDINDQYQVLKDDEASQDHLSTELFEATVSYFAAHVALYNKLSKKGDVGEAKGVSQQSVDDESELPEAAQEQAAEEEIIFTPVIDSEAEQTAHAEQVEEVSSKDDEDVIEDESTEAEVREEEPEDQIMEDDEVEEEFVVESASDDGNDEEYDEPNQDDEADDQEDALVQEDDIVDEEPEVEEANEPKESIENQGDTDLETDGTSAEVSNEVTIAEKEVIVEEEKPARPLSINEIMSAQRKAGSGTNSLFAARHGNTERVADIKSAISLNDKLLFIKDLFNGYSLAYSEAIELLNRYDSFESADAFLKSNYAEKNNWAEKQATVDKLYIILRKRFG